MASPATAATEEDGIRKRYAAIIKYDKYMLILIWPENAFIEALKSDLGRHPVEAYCGGGLGSTSVSEYSFC